MKKIKVCLLTGALALAFSLQPPALAQSSTNAPASTSPQSIFDSAEQFFVSFGPYSFTNEHGFFETGAALQNNVNVGATLELGAPIYHTSSGSSLDLISETLNAGIAGTIVQEELDLAWSINVHDVKVLLGVGGGYDFQEHRLFPGVFAELQKKLTANTHIFLRAEDDFEGKVSAPMVVAGAGFTF